MVEKTDRRGFIRKSALIGTAGITGLLGTAGNAAADSDVPGQVIVYSYSNSWYYSISFNNADGEDPPVEKLSKADGNDSINGPQVAGNINDGYIDNFQFHDEINHIVASPDGGDSSFELFTTTGNAGEIIKIVARNNRFDYTLTANSRLRPSDATDDSDKFIDGNTVEGYVLGGGTDNYRRDGYISYLSLTDPYTGNEGLVVDFR